MTSERRQRLHPNLRRGRGPTDKESVKSPSSRTRGLKRGGSPGRKKGVPNKVTREVQALAQGIVEDPAVQATMLAQARRGRLAPPVLAMLFYYAYGKPKERVEVGVEPKVKKLVILIQ